MRLFVLVGLIIGWSVLWVSPTQASTSVERQEIPEAQFVLRRDITYTVSRSPDILVEEQVAITNLTSQRYPKEFKLVLASARIGEVYAVAGDQPLGVQVSEEEFQTVVTIALPEIFGESEQVRFELVYRLEDAAKHLGEITEFTLPRFNAKELDKESKITVLVDASLQEQTFMFPKANAYAVMGDFHRYEYSAETLSNVGVKAIFGKRQLYQFTIFYHLEDEKIRGGNYELILPPDTNYQRVFLTEFSQQPEEVVVDRDGNWIGKFDAGKVHSPVVVKGTAMVYPEPVHQNAFAADGEDLVGDDRYWEVNDPEIVNAASSLGGVREIYDFVVNYLTYDHQKPGEAESRQGAKEALAKPRFANCMEYTDLFISLARAKGIPARRVVGYAHSENAELQPLALLADVLHAWPEYWDDEAKVWRAVDPTWQSTSRGVDYFSTWDARHIAFSINGSSSTLPLPPGSRQSPAQSKNILVTPLQSFLEEEVKLEPEVAWSSIMWPMLPYRGELVVKNLNQYAHHQLEVKMIPTDGYSVDSQTQIVPVVPPLGEARIGVRVKLAKLWMMETFVVELGGVRYEIPVSPQYRVWQKIVFGGMLLLYASLAGITVIIARKAWGVSVSK